MTRVFVAAGSNIDPLGSLRRALDALEHRFGALQISSAYQNTAVGFAGPDFVNLAVGFDTDLDLHALIAELRRIEMVCGREPGAPKWSSRAMDLDILLFGDLIHEEPSIKLPRPCLLRRAYMLGPMAEIAAEVRHPTAGVTIGELWSRFDRSAHPLKKVQLTHSA
jgi:2-amino-4-hydroxy-6-hydroxymethyldihydropteridine diphosphokinase